jgi:glycosyltransferase involved in cell wall biosynthesis
MRILHVIHTFPPYSRAGSENYAEALAREQRRRHEVCVFHRVAEADRPEYEVREGVFEGLPVARLNRTFRDLDAFRGTYRSQAVAEAFGGFLDRFAPSVVHFHHVTCLSTTCVEVAADRGIPVVYTLHDYWLICPRGQLLRRDEQLSVCASNTEADCVRCMAWQLRMRGGHARVKDLTRRAAELARWKLPRSVYQRLALRPFLREDAAREEISDRVRSVRAMCERVDCFVAPSRYLRDRYLGFGIPGARLLHSDYGFDLDPWGGSALREPDPHGRLRVAYLGTWIPPKGVHLLLEAFRELDSDRFVLYLHGHAVPYEGDESYERRLRDLAARLPHVRIGGAYTPAEIPGLLAAADVLAVPSIWYENSPLTIHEAFLSRLPVVASAQGGMEELVRHEENGLTFRPRSPRALAAALRRLLEEPELFEKLRQTRTAVKSIQENARELEALYDHLRAGRRSAHASLPD